MKKLFTTMTALAFVLGLTAAGYTQTTVKEEAKPAVKTQTTAGSQVTPTSKDTPAIKDKSKSKESAKPVTKESGKASKKAESMAVKKDNGKKPVASATETKKEESKDAAK
jgi:hypothetical protein